MTKQNKNILRQAIILGVIVFGSTLAINYGRLKFANKKLARQAPPEEGEATEPRIPKTPEEARELAKQADKESGEMTTSADGKKTKHISKEEIDKARQKKRNVRKKLRKLTNKLASFDALPKSEWGVDHLKHIQDLRGKIGLLNYQLTLI